MDNVRTHRVLSACVSLSAKMIVPNPCSCAAGQLKAQFMISFDIQTGRLVVGCRMVWPKYQQTRFSGWIGMVMSCKDLFGNGLVFEVVHPWFPTALYMPVFIMEIKLTTISDACLTDGDGRPMPPYVPPPTFVVVDYGEAGDYVPCMSFFRF